MNKNLVGILFFALFGVASMAQSSVTATQSLVKTMKANGEFFSFSVASDDIKGSPYLNEDFMSGMVHWNDTWNEGIDLRYNIYQSDFEVKTESGVIVIDPIKNNIDTLKYRDEVFVKKYLKVDKDLLVVYLSLLGQQNDFALYKQYRIILTEAVTDTDLYNKAKPAEFKSQKPAYYVFKGNEHWTVKGNKSLAEIFQIDAKEVKSYLKENKYHLSNEDQLLEAVLHFSGAIIP